MKILSIDIGGTKSAIGLCALEGHRVTSVSSYRKFASRDFASLPAMISSWMVENPGQNFEAIGAGVAGPVIDGHVHLTNLGWDIDSQTMIQRFEKPFRICNDMESHGWGLLGLRSKDLIILNEGKPGPGAKALIAGGTGLGEAIIGWNGMNHHPMPGEGGHSSFSPTNTIEDELLKFLRIEFKGHVSWERILGGKDGFRNLSKFLAHHRSIKLPAFLSNIADQQQDWGAAIISAEQSGDPFARDVLAMYATLYGREAANLALKCVPRSGIYLGGGIAPRITTALKQNFMHGFTDKGRFSELLGSIPVYIITDDLNGLKGAAIQYCAQ